VFYEGDRGRPAIYLTFDDCYSLSLVSQAMAIAESSGARLTFLPVGTMVQSAADFWRSVVARGHAIEDHTWTHPRLSRLTTDQITREVLSQADAVEAAVGDGYRPKFLRPPYGDGVAPLDTRIPAIAANLDMKVAMWSADSNGWKVNPRTDQAAIDFVLSNVFMNFFPGTIVLQHAIAVRIPGDDVLELRRPDARRDRGGDVELARG